MSSAFSQSQSRLSTPTRAITTTLSARSSPPIPGPSQVYLPLVKSVLRHRLLYSVFLYSSICAWAMTILWETWNGIGGIKGLLLRPFMPQTLVFAVLQWMTGALPAIVLRKIYLSTNQAPATSPAKTLSRALGKPGTLRQLAVYVGSAASLTVVHILMAYVSETDPRLSLFVKSKKHPLYLNARVVYMMFSQITLAAVFMFRNTMLNRFVVRRVNVPAASLAAQTVAAAVVIASMSSVLATFVFGALRITVLPILFRLPVISQVLRPFTGHFIRASSGWTIWLPFTHVGLIIRTFFLGLFTALSWECAEGLFDIFISQPIVVANMTPDPFTTLISAISSPSDESMVFLQHAYTELAALAAEDSTTASAQRTALFGDQKYNPAMWPTLANETLLLLGNDYRHLLGRGAPAPPAAVTPAPAPVKSFVNESPSTPLIRRHIFKSAKQSPVAEVFETLGSDGILSKAVDEVSEEVQVPALFRSVEQAGTKTVTDVEVKVKEIVGGLHPVKYVRNTLAAFSPEWANSWSKWWTRERLSKTVEACVPHRELDAVVVEVLSTLVCASLTEDRYGVVQRDIPKILEAFLSFLTAVEDYQVEVNAKYQAPAADATGEALAESEKAREEVARAGEALGVVTNALKDGVTRIVRTFGEKLRVFKFPPRTARKLQGFVDYI